MTRRPSLSSWHRSRAARAGVGRGGPGRARVWTWAPSKQDCRVRHPPPGCRRRWGTTGTSPTPRVAPCGSSPAVGADAVDEFLQLLGLQPRRRRGRRPAARSPRGTDRPGVHRRRRRLAGDRRRRARHGGGDVDLPGGPRGRRGVPTVTGSGGQLLLWLYERHRATRPPATPTPPRWTTTCSVGSGGCALRTEHDRISVVDARRETLRSLFDAVAENYDRWGGLLRADRRRAGRRLDPRPGERALDLGCRRGAALLPIAGAVGPTGSVWAAIWRRSWWPRGAGRREGAGPGRGPRDGRPGARSRVHHQRRLRPAVHVPRAILPARPRPSAGPVSRARPAGWPGRVATFGPADPTWTASRAVRALPSAAAVRRADKRGRRAVRDQRRRRGPVHGLRLDGRP